MGTVNRYQLTIPVEWNMGDEVLSAKIQYATYATSEKEAIEIGQLFVQDDARYIAKSMAERISEGIHQVEPSITDDIEVEQVPHFSEVENVRREGSLLVGDV